MRNAEFEKFYSATAEEVERIKTEGYNSDGIRCWLVGWIGGYGNYTFTGKQIEQLFNLSFGIEKPLTPASKQGHKNNTTSLL